MNSDDINLYWDGIYNSIYYSYNNSPTFTATTKTIQKTPEELATQYVKDMRKYKQQMHQLHIQEKILDFMRIYQPKRMKQRASYIPHEPRLPRPEDKTQQVTVLKSTISSTTSESDSKSYITYINSPSYRVNR